MKIASDTQNWIDAEAVLINPGWKHTLIEAVPVRSYRVDIEEKKALAKLKIYILLFSSVNNDHSGRLWCKYFQLDHFSLNIPN